MSVKYRCVLAGALALLAGCDNPPGIESLEQELQVLRETAGVPAPSMPTRVQHPAFAYDATALRSPFQGQPGDEGPRWQVSDTDHSAEGERSKSRLESIDLEQFEMVGTLSDQYEDSVLLRASGVVHRLQPGDYLGRQNGRIVALSPHYVEVFEVISDGRGGWLERTLTISLKQQS